MELASFKKSAAYIVQRNVSERVMRVRVSFDSGTGSLRLVYCTEAEPVDDDWEDCELACVELIAEFPEITRAATDCCPLDQCPVDYDAVVFVRS